MRNISVERRRAERPVAESSPPEETEEDRWAFQQAAFRVVPTALVLPPRFRCGAARACFAKQQRADRQRASGLRSLALSRAPPTVPPLGLRSRRTSHEPRGRGLNAGAGSWIRRLSPRSSRLAPRASLSPRVLTERERERRRRLRQIASLGHAGSSRLTPHSSLLSPLSSLLSPPSSLRAPPSSLLAPLLSPLSARSQQQPSVASSSAPPPPPPPPPPPSTSSRRRRTGRMLVPAG